MANPPPPGTMPPGQDTGPSPQDSQPSGQDIQQNPGQIQPQSPTISANGQKSSRWKSFQKNPCCCIELRQGVLYVENFLIVYFCIVGLLFMLRLTGSCTILVDDPEAALRGSIMGLLASGFGIISAVILAIGVIKKSILIDKLGRLGHVIVSGGLLGLYIGDLVYLSKTKRWAEFGYKLAAKIVDICVFIYTAYVISNYIKELEVAARREQQQQQQQGGQFPGGPNQQLSYQPSVPNVGYSQTSLSPGGGQPLAQ